MKRMVYWCRALIFGMAVTVIILGISGIIIKDHNSFILWFVFVLLVLFSATIMLPVRRARWLQYEKYITAVLIIALLLVQSLVATALYTRSGWDVGVVNKIAESYIQRQPIDQTYLTRYPNNIPITIASIIIYKAAGILGVSGYGLQIMVNIILLFSASVGILYVVRGLFGRRAALFAYIFVMIFISISPYVAVFYTDVLGLWCVALFAVCLYALHAKPTLPRAVSLGLFAAASILVKVTAGIVLIAAMMTVLLSWRQSAMWIKCCYRQIIMAIISTVVTLVVYSAGLHHFHVIRSVDRAEVDRYSFSMLHFLGMGSLRGVGEFPECREGGYCTRYVDTMASLPSAKLRNQKALSILQYNLMYDFPMGYPSFMLYKIQQSFSDGSFTMWGEGISATLRFSAINRLEEEIQERLAPPTDAHPHTGRFFRATTIMWQAAWLVLLCFMLVGLVGSRWFGWRSRWLLFTALTIIGVALYQGVLESRARYIYLYMPIFIIVASAGFVVLRTAVWRWWKKWYAGT